MFLTSCGFHRSAGICGDAREYLGEIVRRQRDKDREGPGSSSTGFVNDYHVALIIACGPQFSPPPVHVFLAKPSPRKSPGTEGVFLSVVSGGSSSPSRQFPKPTLANTRPNGTGEAVTQVAFRCLAGGSPVDTTNRTGSPIAAHGIDARNVFVSGSLNVVARTPSPVDY